jgi:hypothetical protein
MTRKQKVDTKQVMLAPNGLIPFGDKRIPYPDMLGSYKLDGNRCFIRHDGAILTRNMLPQPNKNLAKFLGPLADYAKDSNRCFDMELFIPNATHHGVHGSIFNAHDKPIPRDTQVHVFDTFSGESWEGRDSFAAFEDRVKVLRAILEDFSAPFIAVEQRVLRNAAEAQAMFEEALELGHEGIMLRRADGGYKNHSRCTHKEALLLKFKAEETVDGVIVEVEQQLKMKEGIKRTRNAFGRMENPTKNADNYEPTDSVGSFLVKDDEGRTSRVMFAAGVADQEQRRTWWKKRKSLIGKYIEFKAFPGGKDGIRSGRMIRWRPDKD